MDLEGQVEDVVDICLHRGMLDTVGSSKARHLALLPFVASTPPTAQLMLSACVC